MSYGKVVRDELRVPTRELRHAIPRIYAGYKELHDSALAAGALDARTKELIALAIAVSKECDGCIAAHAHAAVWHGATPQEAAEAIGVTFLMNGGPATVYGARAFAAFREFYDQRAASVTPARDSQPGTSTRSPRPTDISTSAERVTPERHADATGERWPGLTMTAAGPER
jgi:AhpD family alkylhydroperoxidase